MDSTSFAISIAVLAVLIIFNITLLVRMILFIRDARKRSTLQNPVVINSADSGVRRRITLVDTSALDQYQYSAAAEFDAVLERRTQDLSKAFIEQQRLAQWVEELASKGELDPAKLAATAERQAYALAVKMAEDKVKFAASALSDIRQELCAAQKRLSCYTKNQWFSLVESGEKAITQLTAQESDAQKMLTEAQKALSALTEPLVAES